ncbi:MAG TPA: response regulator [Thermoanaerobaculia bacterium]|nr:response regulator [Thermoanaerobaculia bacterium]
MGGKPKVLLVEDNADVRRLYAIGLNQRGFEVKLAANGAEAVDRVASERPDFILLDWRMPLMDGGEVIERLGAQEGSAEIAIIVISGQPAPVSLPPRIRSWLMKPLTVDELVHALMEGGEGGNPAHLHGHVRQVS